MVPTVQARPEDFDFAMVEEADGHIPDSKTMGMLLRFEAQRGIELTRSNLNDSAVWDPDALSGIAASRFGTAARNLKQGQADKARTATASRPVSHADVCTELRGLVPAGLLYVWVGVRSVGLRACICRETRNGDARLHRGGLLRGMDGGEEGQHHNVLAAVWTGMARSEHADQPSTAASLGGLRRRTNAVPPQATTDPSPGMSLPLTGPFMPVGGGSTLDPALSAAVGPKQHWREGANGGDSWATVKKNKRHSDGAMRAPVVDKGNGRVQD
ncbi:hypothetical protein V8E36_002867 [Tilletia maclaganii]